MYRKGMPFTQEDIGRARSVSLVGYLESCGMELKRKGRMYCLEEHDSLVINPDTNHWHWNSHNIHGVNAVDFIMAYDNRTFLDAVAELLGRPPNYSRPAVAEEEPEKHIFTLPPRNANMHRLYAYLTQTRCIDADVVTYFVRDKTLYEDDHHNCVFIGCNELGKPVYAFQRGTLTDISYKGECIHSDKRYTFGYDGTENRLYIFEAAVDLLSYLTITQDWDSSFLSLGGLSDVALQHYLTLHPHITDLTFCLDNDVPGIMAAVQLKRKYQKQYQVKIQSPGSSDLKDWNARLVLERRNMKTPKKASFFKGGTNTLLVFSRPEDVRLYLESAATNQKDSLLLTGEHPEADIAAFQKMILKEKRQPITNIQVIPTIAG